MANEAWAGASMAPGVTGAIVGQQQQPSVAAGGALYGANPGTSMMGFNPNSKNFAQEAFAAITRQQWDDYLRNYVPEENRLIEYAMDEEKPQEASYLAGRGIEQAFGRQRESAQRQLSGMGLQLTEEEQAAADKQSRLSESLATVGAMNTARDVTMQRQQSVTGNPAPALPKGVL